ncbi:MAG TPA: hypothetical protein VFX46_02375 [Hyphomicrobiaceae bacterium]|jgi:hypothetical protein|nr:hypothetical protein [Hyphomicrobiaceae bacterium]
MTARSLIVLACLWIAGVSYVAGINWPVFPLDLPAADPEVRAVYDRAIWAHVVQYSLIALIPAAALLGVSRAVSRRRKNAP